MQHPFVRGGAQRILRERGWPRCPVVRPPRLVSRADRHNPMVTLTITNYRDLFTNIRKRPGVWLIREDFATVVAFVEGCDEANVRSLLIGFQPWLVTQAGCLDSHVWWSIVAHLTEPVGPKNFRDMEPDLDARAVETLFDLLDEFLELRGEHNGLNRIFAAYKQWQGLREQDGCDATDATACPAVRWPRPASRIKPDNPSVEPDQLGPLAQVLHCRRMPWKLDPAVGQPDLAFLFLATRVAPTQQN
jgi:hypothetical protein